MTTRFLNELQVFLTGNTKDKNSGPPLLLKYRSSTTFILLTVSLAIFTDIFFYGLIVPVVPFSLTIQAGVAEDNVQQWTAILLAAYNASLFIGSPIVGIYADHTSSRRLPLLFGLVALAASTLLLCLGNSIALLMVGRILQGLSAAIVWSVGLALLADTMGRKIGYAMGWVSIAMSVGLLISPVVGGAVYAAAGYYAVYYIAFGIIVCDVLLRLVLIEKKVARQWLREVDELPRGPLVENTTGQETDLPPSSETDNNVQLAGGHSVEASLPPKQEASSNPQEEQHLPIACGQATKRPHWELIKSPRILGSLLGVVIQAGGMFALDTVVPLFVKETFHWDSTAAGTIFICIMIPGFTAPLIGAWADRHGAKWPSTSGFLLSVPPFVCLRFVTENSIGHKVLLCALLLIIGFTFCLCNTPLMAEVSYAIDEKEIDHPGFWGEKGVYGIAYGLFTTAFALGGTIGSLTAGYLQAGPGWSTMTWAIAIWIALGAVIVGSMLGGKPSNSNTAPPSGSTSGGDNEGSAVEENRGETV